MSAQIIESFPSPQSQVLQYYTPSSIRIHLARIPDNSPPPLLPSCRHPTRPWSPPVTAERCTREGAPRLVSTPLTHSALTSNHSMCGVIWTMDSGWSSRNERMEKSTSTGDGWSMSMGLVTPNGNTGWV